MHPKAVNVDFAEKIKIQDEFAKIVHLQCFLHPNQVVHLVFIQPNRNKDKKDSYKKV